MQRLRRCVYHGSIYITKHVLAALTHGPPSPTRPPPSFLAIAERRVGTNKGHLSPLLKAHENDQSTLHMVKVTRLFNTITKE